MKTDEQQRLDAIARKTAYEMFSPASHNAVMAFDIIGLAITEALAPVVKERDELKKRCDDYSQAYDQLSTIRLYEKRDVAARCGYFWDSIGNGWEPWVCADKLRAERDQLRADNERLREKINEALSCIDAVRNNNDRFHAWAFIVGTLNEALNPTPTKEMTK